MPCLWVFELTNLKNGEVRGLKAILEGEFAIITWRGARNSLNSSLEILSRRAVYSTRCSILIMTKLNHSKEFSTIITFLPDEFGGFIDPNRLVKAFKTIFRATKWEMIRMSTFSNLETLVRRIRVYTLTLSCGSYVWLHFVFRLLVVFFVCCVGCNFLRSIFNHSFVFIELINTFLYAYK